MIHNESQQKIKTLIFSELPKKNKIKYFEFPSKNDIKFSKDTKDNYIASVKLLNPSFYNEDKKNIDISKNNESKIRSKSALNYREIKNKNLGNNLNKVLSQKIMEIKNKNNKNNIKLNKTLFEKDNTKLNTTTTNYSEVFEGRYVKFIKLVNPLVCLRGKLMNINSLHYLIEEIYSLIFINKYIKKINEKIFPFPNYVLNFLKNKCIKNPPLAQRSLDLITSIDFYKSKDIIIKIFSSFLNEKYDSDDLDFYLYVRFCIEQELNISFMELSLHKNKKNNTKEKDKNSFNTKTCLNLVKKIYGEKHGELVYNFMGKIEEFLIQQKNEGINTNKISLEQILKYTLQIYQKYKHKKQENKPLYFQKKISTLKIILRTYIKEKELDIFLKNLISVYKLDEKSKNKKNNEKILILEGIKDLICQKVNSLIKILFEQNKREWYKSLRLKETDKKAKEYYDKLTALLQEMINYEKLKDIPEIKFQNFGETLLTTPELYSNINKLVVKRFIK